MDKDIVNKIAQLEAENERLRKLVNRDSFSRMAYFETITKLLPDVVFISDANGTYLDILEYKSDLLYLDSSELIGKTFEEVLPENKAEVAERALRQVIDSGESIAVEYKLNVNNQEKSFEVRVTPVLGIADQFMFVVFDTTQQKLMDEMLENSRYQLHKAQDIAQLAYFDVDIKANQIKFSKELNTLLKVPPDLTISLDYFLSLVGKEDRQKIVDGIKTDVFKNGSFIYEYQIVIADKSTRRHIINSEIYQSGNSSRIFGVIQDVTDLRSLEREHIKQTEQSKAMLRAIPDMVFIQNESGIFLDCHCPIGQKLNLYVKPSEFIGKRSIDVLPPDVAIDNINNIRKVLQNKQSVIFEYSMLIDGSVFFFESRMVSAGKKQVLSIVREVTAQKRAEEDLLKAKLKAEESDRLKSIFLANISHEIRTPMNAIIGFSQFLLKDDISYDDKVEYFKIVEKSSYELMNLIDDIIDISKIEASLLPLNMTVFSINELLVDLEKIYLGEIELSEREIVLTVEYIENENQVLIKSDRVRLKQVLENLISNAVKFTSQGEVRITAEVIDKQLFLSVKDTGVGIPEMAQKYIFERFRRITSPVDKIYRGAGLGLAVSKGLVELMGGEIWVDSELGRGSVFSCKIPI